METWKDYPGVSGYQVLDLGRVRSCKKSGSIRDRYGSQWRVLTPGSVGRGYLQVCLRREGRAHMRRVHCMILETFVGPKVPGQECRHLNGNPSDNRLSNLRWGTPLDNSADRRRHGRIAAMGGELNPRARLSEMSVRTILRLAEFQTVTRREIAAAFGVCHATIAHILCGRSWRSVPRRAA